MPTADNPVVQGLAFIAFLLLVFVCMGGFVVWLKVLRGNKVKRKRRKHKHRRPLNPTLSQTGGLPPKRDTNLPPPGP